MYSRIKPKGILVNFLVNIETEGAGANAKATLALGFDLLLCISTVSNL